MGGASCASAAIGGPKESSVATSAARRACDDARRAIELGERVHVLLAAAKCRDDAQPQRVRVRLEGRGVETPHLADLPAVTIEQRVQVRQTEAQILQVKNIGKKSLQEIAELLEKEGLNFGMRYEESTDGVRILDMGTPPSRAAENAPDDEDDEQPRKKKRYYN